MNEPLVSIITPTLNPGHRLQRCIESVAAQTYANVEHLVIDAGSIDGTLELLRSRPNVRWVSEPDEGQADALNKGFRMAAGELLTWINGDDTLEPGAVEAVVKAWQTTGAEWIYGNCEMWEGSKSHYWDPPGALTETSFDWVCPIAQQGTFFTKRAFEAVGGIDPSFDLSMDYDLWLRFFEAGVRSVYVDEVLGRFEIHDESKSGSRGFDEFMLEGAIALRRRGRVQASDLMIGRAAAQRSSSRRETGVRDSDIKRALAEIVDSRTELQGVDRQLAMAGARAEAADIELRSLRAPRHLLGLRHLLRVGPWKHRLTRSSAVHDLKIAAARAVQRPPRR